MSDKYLVDGIEISGETESKKAEKELEAIKHIREKMNIDNPDNALKVYNMLVSKKMLKTLVGGKFLCELYEKIENMEGITIDPLPPIAEDYKFMLIDSEREKRKREEKAAKLSEELAQEGQKWRLRCINSVIINVVLVIAIGAMFYINYSKNSITILNYEVELRNKYASWAEELESKEAYLKEYEKKLNDSSDK